MSSDQGDSETTRQYPTQNVRCKQESPVVTEKLHDACTSAARFCAQNPLQIIYYLEM